MGLINIAGNVYATELFWKMLDEIESPKKEIIRLGISLGRDMVCTPSTSHPLQAGYAYRSELNTRSTVRSLAGALVEGNPGSWLGLFEIPDDTEHYYFIAIRDDHIIADSDHILKRKDARKAFEQMLTFGGWAMLTIPVGLSYPGVTNNHLSLTDMLGKSKGPKIRPLTFKATDLPLVKIGIVVGAALVMYGGYFGYTLFNEEQERERQALEAQQLELARQQAEAAARIIPAWESAIQTRAFLLACQQRWLDSQQTIVGWQLKNWSCDQHQVISAYEKIADSISALPFMSALNDQSITFSTDMKKASVTQSIVMNEQGILPPPSRSKAGKAFLMDFADHHSIKFSSQNQTNTALLPGEKTKAAIQNWTTEKINLDLNYSAFELINSNIEQVPGFAMTRIMTETEGATGVWQWHIDGEIYAQ